MVELPPYNTILYISMAVTAGLVFQQRSRTPPVAVVVTNDELSKLEEEEEDLRVVAEALPSSSKSFLDFRNKYLIVYLLMVCGDWLQGPYVYSLYSRYGFSREDIALLFVLGFGASMVMGTFIGSLADANGRKKFCLLYAVLYILSCLTKHVNSFYILLLGRLLGGISTSLLFSVFESWLVCECNAKKFGPDKLSEIFTLQIFLNSVVAIASGLVAQFGSDVFPLMEWHHPIYLGGYTSPFDLAIVVLALGFVLCWWTWEENYGSSSQSSSHQDVCSMTSLQQGLVVLKNSRPVLLCGLVQSLFEAAMYSFVFEWTPALTPSPNVVVPYGTIFATFMVCCMGGSQLVKKSLELFTPRGGSGGGSQHVLPYVFLLSAVGLAGPVLDANGGVGFTYYGFLVFEFMVGMYFPLMGTLKSQIVPEQNRSTIYNLFRIPLNGLVLFVLMNHFTVSQTFQISVALLLLAAALQFWLIKELAQESKGHV